MGFDFDDDPDAAVGPAGPKGDKGDPGDIGPQGPAGADGNDGADGAVGPKGAPGDIGPQGPAGADGNDGADGAVGPKGDKGDPGDIGPQGLAGADGNDGADGAVGPKGDKGDQGEIGLQGPAGADGNDGPIVDFVFSVKSGTDSTANHIPRDATPPQKTEGKEWDTLAFTPSSGTNWLEIDFFTPLISRSSASWLSVAIFKDDESDAIGAATSYEHANTSGEFLSVKVWVQAGTTSEIIFKVRFGGNLGTAYMLETAGFGMFGDSAHTVFKVTEWKA